MVSDKLQPRNVNLAESDWEEIKAYAGEAKIYSVSAALRMMLNHRRTLLAAQRVRASENSDERPTAIY